MELDWSTVVLEIINFIILIWLLKRFLYRPVLNVVEKRQASVRESLQQAEDTQKQAEALQQQYQDRLKTWEQEKSEARREFEEALNQDRARKLETLQSELAREADKAKAAAENQNRQWRREVTEQALQQGSGFAAALMKPLADQHLEEKLIHLFCETMDQWPPSTLEELRNAVNHRPPNVPIQFEISSAFELSTDIRERLLSILVKALGEQCETSFAVDESLLAGIRIASGGWSLGLNLADELRGFAEAHHE
ncbi:ATP F0F1 synthase subunit B [Hahella sp. CCB-MM4]|uniref:F0F1 ATP synthase subunit delta n=1 Tax=Hahella sp. (strain CCB-MM4) TaxID=1926491 RepID=UPI000B9A7D6E|nr:F0F1 ATP synthase subunit delta [Hahella sp. CCB-MM4]OZG70103.1 ATP F0F1 synthase subunit B [Hahella sp. CCB-MM4]